MAELKQTTLGVIGAGNMAEALVRGLVKAGTVPPERIVACDPSEARRAVFEAMGARVSTNNADALTGNVLLLSVKPQMFDIVVGEVADNIQSPILAISIAAGMTTERMGRLLPECARLIRVMPNTPMLVGRGASCLARGRGVGDEDMALALSMFRTGGVAYEVDEAEIDAVTAVSGSGPAYVFRFIEAFAAASEAAGLSPELSAVLARETVVGAAKLLEESGETPQALREKVTTPGGTTAAALTTFTEEGLERIVAAAVNAARVRSVELGQD